MKKYFPKISASALVLTLVFVVSGLAFPQTAQAIVSELVKFYGPNLDPLVWLVTALGAVSIAILKIAEHITGLAGLVLNYVVQYSVVNMKLRIDESSVNNAWGVIRDVANMSFIFVLLYAAIQTILGIGEDAKKLIVRIIVVAILINFSLFFTKIVIDVSNILAITFYDAIAPGALNKGMTYGISSSLMDPLKLTSIYKLGAGLASERLLVIGVMGTIVSLIASFVFFAISIMFIIRFVVLIFVLILSPIAFVSFVLPQMDEYRKQWWNALSGQAFFAPIYFMLTWIVIMISRGLLTQSGGSLGEVFTGAINATGEVGTPSESSVGIFVNFAIMIAMLIASLMIAKQWANKAGPGAAGLTKWAMGAASDKAFGGLGWAGRTSAGRLGTATAESAALQTSANKQRSGFLDRTKGAASRLALYASKKAGGGTYDVRNATIPTSVIGAAIEGTVGRTRVGKALGLHDVPIPSIQVGAFAAGQTGVGEGGKKSFVDIREESRKRVETRENTKEEELRKAKSKAAIQAGMATGASATEITEMQKIIKDMTNKEVAALEQNTLANKNVAEALTAQHLKAINDGDKSETDKREIFTKHFANVSVAVEALGNPAILATLTPAQETAHKNTIKNISEKEMDFIPTSVFDPNKLDPTTPAGATPEGARSRAFLKTITQGQVDSLTKGDKLIASEKQAVKDARIRPLNDAFATGNWIGTPNSAVEIMRGMKPETLVQLDDAKLTDMHILELYSPALLNKMAVRSELTEGKALAIRTAILTAGPGAPGSNQEAAFNWLLGDGLNIF